MAVSCSEAVKPFTIGQWTLKMTQNISNIRQKSENQTLWENLTTERNLPSWRPSDAVESGD